jgi:hypothetical protein
MALGKEGSVPVAEFRTDSVDRVERCLRGGVGHISSLQLSKCSCVDSTQDTRETAGTTYLRCNRGGESKRRRDPSSTTRRAGPSHVAVALRLSPEGTRIMSPRHDIETRGKHQGLSNQRSPHGTRPLSNQTTHCAVSNAPTVGAFVSSSE